MQQMMRKAIYPLLPTMPLVCCRRVTQLKMNEHKSTSNNIKTNNIVSVLFLEALARKDPIYSFPAGNA